MNRYNFMQSQGQKTIPQPELTPNGNILVGQRWLNQINGSTLEILERTKRGQWMVNETMKGNFRTHNNGEKEVTESFILTFHKPL